MSRENDNKWVSEVNHVVKRKGIRVLDRIVVDCTEGRSGFNERARAAGYLAKKLNAMDEGLTLSEMNLPKWKQAVHAGFPLRARNLLAVEEPLLSLQQILDKVDDYALTARGIITAKELAEMRLELVLLRNRVASHDNEKVTDEVPAVASRVR